jgi:hypothetical protein
MTGNYARQVSLFGNPRITVWLPTPRGLSQAPTSFIGSWCQGIHRAPLSTWRLQLMLASTMQFSRYGRPRDKTRRIHGGQSRSSERKKLTPVPSGPNSVLSQFPASAGVRFPEERTRPALPGSWPTSQCSTVSSHPGTSAPDMALDAAPSRETRQVLLRKEVIQPHLPVRLPCYDFVPIADPTFDGSLPDGLGHRLRVLPTFVT